METQLKRFNILLLDVEAGIIKEATKTQLMEVDDELESKLADILREHQSAISTGEPITISHHKYTSNGKIIEGLRACSNSDFVHFIPIRHEKPRRKTQNT